MIRFSHGAATSVGRVRQVNEDSYLAVPPLFVVADGMGGHGSGDLAIAFSTGTDVPHYPKELTMPVNAMNNTHLDPLFDATIECTEEAIDNALCKATTTIGNHGNTVYALPYPELRASMRKHGHPVK